MTPATDASQLLLVDDDDLVRMMASATLTHAGFDVVEATGGEEALQLFAARHFDLILLDVMMPDMDGHTVCKRMRSQLRGVDVPIVMLTGLDDTDSIELAYRNGATDFITKPINWTLLTHRIRYSLRASLMLSQMKRGEASLARALRLASMGHWEWSLKRSGGHTAGPSGEQTIACSSELCSILGLDYESNRNLRPQRFLDLVRSNDRDRVGAARQALCRDGEAYQISFGLLRSNGELREVFEHAVAIRDGEGRIAQLEGITQDITARIEAERRIQHLALHDALTGLANRQFFTEMTELVLERSRRLHTLCALLHLDLDRFKSVNDALGELAGDLVLRTIAERIPELTRSSDMAMVHSTARNSEVLARIGSNSFIILLVDVHREQYVTTIAERLLQGVAAPMSILEREVVVTGSIGIALFPRDGVTVEGLSRHAEQAMYAAKADGRSGYRFYNEEMNAIASAKLEGENELRRAIAENQLRLYFQPKIDVGSGRMSSAEVLVRWQHPHRGLVPPGEFIPLAEESGLIVALGDWVLHATCATLRRWKDAGLAPVPLSINLASPSFTQDSLIVKLEDAIGSAGIKPQLLTLELTESLLMDDVENILARLHRLHEMGFGL